jgi:hypothetical protein
MPWMTVDQCKRSLAARPCEATLRELDDCARMLLEIDAGLSDAPTQDKGGCDAARCEAYFTAPHCDGVVLTRGVLDPNAGPLCSFLVQ